MSTQYLTNEDLNNQLKQFLEEGYAYVAGYTFGNFNFEVHGYEAFERLTEEEYLKRKQAAYEDECKDGLVEDLTFEEWLDLDQDDYYQRIDLMVREGDWNEY